jgi:hypothetical protein
MDKINNNQPLTLDSIMDFYNGISFFQKIEVHGFIDTKIKE